LPQFNNVPGRCAASRRRGSSWVYCGVPAANHAFALAKPILEEQASER